MEWSSCKDRAASLLLVVVASLATLCKISIMLACQVKLKLFVDMWLCSSCTQS